LPCVPAKVFSGTFELLTRADSDPVSLAVEEGMPKNVSVIPSRTELSEIETYVSKFMDTKDLFRVPLAKARLAYDLILIDTPPSARFPTTVSTYVAADWFLLSAFPHALAIYGLNEALADIADVRVDTSVLTDEEISVAILSKLGKVNPGSASPSPAM
jgi:cellulose biosynthesis protein BcsQ